MRLDGHDVLDGFSEPLCSRCATGDHDRCRIDAAVPLLADSAVAALIAFADRAAPQLDIYDTRELNRAMAVLHTFTSANTYGRAGAT